MVKPVLDHKDLILKEIYKLTFFLNWRKLEI